jgi:hypothetical protein
MALLDLHLETLMAKIYSRRFLMKVLTTLMKIVTSVMNLGSIANSMNYNFYLKRSSINLMISKGN